MEGGIDGGGDLVLAEGGERIEGDHFVFERFAAIDAFELDEAVEIEQREAGFLDGADVAAAAFDGEHADGFAGEGVGHFDLGAGVAAAEVGDAEVGAEQIGTVAEQGQLVGAELCGLGVVPEVFQQDGMRSNCGHREYYLTSRSAGND